MTLPPLRAQILTRALLADVVPTAAQADQLVDYYSLLERWNEKINLTAMPLSARADATIDRLIVEPLIASRQLDDTDLNWFDFGSGGGSPALPLKILRPFARLTMVEAKERKAAFLREAVSSLGLSFAVVQRGRIEELDAEDAFQSVDLITARAVRMDAELLGAARNLLKMHGRLLLFRGQADGPDSPGFVLRWQQDLFPSSGYLSTLERAT
jgi:16S rRNA (guanine527-N7)-methyltransferase